MAEPKPDAMHAEEPVHEKQVHRHRDIDQGNEAVLLRVGTADIEDGDLKLARDGHVRLTKFKSAMFLWLTQ